MNTEKTNEMTFKETIKNIAKKAKIPVVAGLAALAIGCSGEEAKPTLDFKTPIVRKEGLAFDVYDVNKDGYLDVVHTNLCGYPNEHGQVFVLYGNNKGQFKEKEKLDLDLSYLTPDKGPSFVSFDFNRDGMGDVFFMDHDDFGNVIIQ